MLDPKLVRSQTDVVAQRLKRKNFRFDVDTFNRLEARRKQIQIRTEELQSEQNRRSKEIGKAKAAGEDIQPLLDQVNDLKAQRAQAEDALRVLQEEMNDFVAGIPNLPDEDVPAGESEDDNIEVRTWGEPQDLGFEPRDHVDLGG